MYRWPCGSRSSRVSSRGGGDMKTRGPMRYLPCPFPCLSHTHAHASVTFCLSRPFSSRLSPYHALGQIRTDLAERGRCSHSHLASGCDDVAFFRVLALCLKTFLSIFSPSYSYFFCFCVLLFLRTVCVCAPFPSTNKCIPHSYDFFDGHGTNRNDRISYSYSKT